MTANTTLDISLSPETVDSDAIARIRLEHKPWSTNTGVVPKEDLAATILGRVYGYDTVKDYTPKVDCGVDTAGAAVLMTILAYPSSKNLNYTLRASFGNLSQRVVENAKESEGIIFNNSQEAVLKNSPNAGWTKKWIGSVYTTGGSVTTPPKVTVRNNILTFSRAVKGRLVLQYTVYRHRYTLTISPRSEASKNKYDAAVYALYRGGIAWLVVEPPPYAGAISTDADCGDYDSYIEEIRNDQIGDLRFGNWGVDGWFWYGNTTINGGDDGDGGDDDFEPPKAPKSNKYTVENYCTGEVISESYS